VDCPYCSMPYMEWRMDENTSKGKLWDTNMGLWHDCKESPQAKKKIADTEWTEKRDEVLREERRGKVMKLKAIIFCSSCNKGIQASNPCEHLLADGFEVGVDTANFYSDSYRSTERRKLLRQKNKRKDKPNTTSLDSFK